MVIGTTFVSKSILIIIITSGNNFVIILASRDYNYCYGHCYGWIIFLGILILANFDILRGCRPEIIIIVIVLDVDHSITK